ncbi:hypothetical protein [Clostridioides sp. ZZV15-6597]|uniref:hypothetical protein n=1 Tax=Clostridioides sp. ZZV15-6597 TaxID=2811500 RepID=UPI001D12D1A3|nr:hypothetical protein [Clostridioides sp. ZZV15-6597]HBF1820667.1 hypothetical protein [Clostridioides difficile]
MKKIFTCVKGSKSFYEEKLKHLKKLLTYFFPIRFFIFIVIYILVTFIVIYLMEGKTLDGNITINELNYIKQIELLLIHNMSLAVFSCVLLVLVGVLFLIKYMLECKVKNQKR